MNEFISPSVERILTVLAGHDGCNGNSIYPASDIPNKVWKRKANCDLQKWFKVVVDSTGDDFLDEKISLFARINWEEGCLKSLCIQSVCMKVGTLDAYYCDDKKAVAQYYRLDYDITKALGELFKEPHPHLHLYPKGEPRVPFSKQNSQTILPDFITFLYLNYSYDTWQRWARKVWKRNTNYPDHEDPFQVICDAFKASQHDRLLSTYKDHLQNLKGYIRQEINQRSQPFKPATENWDLLSLY